MITIQVQGQDELAAKMKALPSRLDAALQAAIDEMGEDTASSIVQAATFINFTGSVRSGTKYVPNTSGSGGKVMMPLHGILLGTMDDHWVNMRSDRPELVAWGLQAESKKVQRAAQAIAEGRRQKAPLFVHRHPFIENGFAKAQTTFENVLREHLGRAFI